MQRILTWIKQHRAWTVVLSLCAAAFIAWLFCLPRDLFKGTSYSSVVLSREGELLGARIADDQQWRFPPCQNVPDKYAEALIEFEDKHFKWHPGVDPLALARAVYQNVSEKKVVSGGSTITMQVIRMSRGKERTIKQKIVEAILATRLELRCSKKEILALYATHAPFGGNVVGLEAAAWRYYGGSADDLSWGEAATLAVLPNSPSSIHVGRNRDKLLEKRNRLLNRLYEKGLMDETDYELSVEEPLPSEPLALPSYAFHYVEECCTEQPGKNVTTSIDLGLQKKVEAITDRWCHEFSINGIADMAAVVIDVHTGEILAYVGNADMSRNRFGVKVDIARAPRSTGSTLKPLLYCAMLQDGDILPRTLVQDTPVNINGFAPQNFDLEYSGAVPASEALSRSLNVPSVHMLRQYGVPKFHDLLKKLGMTSLTRPSGDYGLSLILGGGEGKLVELTKIYADISHYYQEKDFKDYPYYDRTAIWYMFDALKEVNRPDEMDWRMISSVRKVAWKTGTSYGFRDGWAIGVTTDYAVGVWAGNAQGQGVPGLVGGRTAGPVMFDIFNVLPSSEWFADPPYGEYVMAEVCHESGHLKGMNCERCDTIPLPLNAMRSEPCPYHRLVDGVGSMFLLPPAMEWYYRQHHPEYEPLPAKKTGYQAMEFIYPYDNSTMTIPRQMDGSVRGIVFNLAHSNPETEVYWHLDSEYIATTRYLHQLSLIPEPGRHTVTVVDADGNTLSIGFTVEG